MPFTPSHAVVALPFAASPALRALGLPAAVAVGSMAPDLPLFLRGTPLSYDMTHDLAWLPLTGVVAILLLLAWRCLLRPAVRELSPEWLAARLPADWDAGALRSGLETVAPRAIRTRAAAPLFPAMLAAAVLLGVISHVVWDLFTHEGRIGLPALDVMWGPLPAYKWLQHGSSVVGLVALGIAGLIWAAKAPVGAASIRVLPTAVRALWWGSLPAILVAAWIVGYAQRGPFTDVFTPAHLAYQVLPPACAAWGALTAALCVAVQVLRARRDTR